LSGFYILLVNLYHVLSVHVVSVIRLFTEIADTGLFGTTRVLQCTQQGRTIRWLWRWSGLTRRTSACASL